MFFEMARTWILERGRLRKPEAQSVREVTSSFEIRLVDVSP